MAKRKPSKKALDTPPWWREGFVPCVAKDPASVTNGPWSMVFMLAPTFEGTLAVQRHPNVPGAIGVRERIIPNAQMKNYTLITDEEKALQSEIQRLKAQMLTEGATREAVRLVGEYSPFTEEELRTMAQKLATKKAPAKKAAAPAKKAPAKKAAAADTEAKSDDRKITVVKKEHGAREGTKRATMLDTIYSAKTVQEAVDAGVAKSDVSWAAREGYIKVA